MTKLFKKEFLRYCVFILLIATTHAVLLFKVLPEIYWLAQPWTIYLLLVPIELFGLWVIYKRYQTNNQSAMKNFLAFMVIKMILCLAFLAPSLLYKTNLTRPYIFQFFAVFFPLLFSELVFLVKILNFEPSKIEKNQKNQE